MKPLLLLTLATALFSSCLNPRSNANPLAPVITSVAGDGSSTTRIATGLRVAGSHLDTVSTAVLKDALHQVVGAFQIASADAATMSLTITPALEQAIIASNNPNFLVSVSNGQSSAEVAVQILRGEQGPSGPAGDPSSAAAITKLETTFDSRYLSLSGGNVVGNTDLSNNGNNKVTLPLYQRAVVGPSPSAQAVTVIAAACDAGDIAIGGSCSSANTAFRLHGGGVANPPVSWDGFPGVASYACFFETNNDTTTSLSTEVLCLKSGNSTVPAHN